MIEGLSKKKCFNHSGREAAARCLECKNFFCPECITEHDGRLTCSNCLYKESQKNESQSGFKIAYVFQGILTVVSVLLISIFFFFFARVLYNSPEEFHYLDMNEEKGFINEDEEYE